jgi:hypothetical protein
MASTISVVPDDRTEEQSGMEVRAKDYDTGFVQFTGV